MRLRALWRLRAGVAVSVAVGLLAAVWTVEQVRVFPPGLSPRALHIAAASTQVVVDTPRSALIDLRQDTYDFEALRNRAVLLGNVIASLPVRVEIARRAHVPLEAVRVAAPRTADFPRAVIGTRAERRTADILRSNNQFRLSIHANPTVPVLDIYAQAPDARSARALANAAVDGLRSRLTDIARSQETPDESRLRLTQLGRARGAVINGGIEWQAVLLVSSLAFGASLAAVVFVSRMRDGWRLAALLERSQVD